MAFDTIFRAYDIRGVYPAQINEFLARKIGNFCYDVIPTKKILVGYDMRLSSKNLFFELVEGITLRGVDVYNIGLCSSAMFYFACAYFGFKAGIMVTASHNTKEFNGANKIAGSAKRSSSPSMIIVCSFLVDK